MNLSSIIEKYDLFIKDQIAYQERAATQYLEREDTLRAAAYADRAKKLQELWSDIEEQQRSLPVVSRDAQLHLSADDLEGLPPELVKELGITESDRKEFLLIELINRMGGIASLNKLLIAIYRETKEVEKRSRLVSRLYRMQNKGMIYSTPDRKGVYSTQPIPEGYFSVKEAGEDEQDDALTE